MNSASAGSRYDIRPKHFKVHWSNLITLLNTGKFNAS